MAMAVMGVRWWYAILRPVDAGGGASHLRCAWQQPLGPDLCRRLMAWGGGCCRADTSLLPRPADGSLSPCPLQRMGWTDSGHSQAETATVMIFKPRRRLFRF